MTDNYFELISKVEQCKDANVSNFEYHRKTLVETFVHISIITNLGLTSQQQRGIFFVRANGSSKALMQMRTSYNCQTIRMNLLGNTYKILSLMRFAPVGFVHFHWW